MAKQDVVGLGALNCDVLYAVERIARGGEEVGILDIKKAPGGSAANTIVALARLGASVGFVGVVGSDEEGQLIVDDFCTEQVATRITRAEGYTGAAIGFVDAEGERALYIYPGVNDQLTMADIDLEFVNDAQFLHTSSFVNDAQLAMQRELARELHAQLSFSPGMLCFSHTLPDLEELIARSAVVFLSLGELNCLVSVGDYERGAEILIGSGAQTVCVTLGAKGCFIADQSGAAHLVAAYPAQAIDTTGAGDAFAAGFLFGLLHEKSLQECGKIGNFVASRCIREYGCRKGLPSARDLSSIE
ncbi:MAG TPA: carbohydrate kinase family protein [Methanomicrobia archaeon]|nr:carbohydrate kinase family protein [Methanomicrobia archaeon]